MSKYCADCANLDDKKSQDGKVSGKLYYCKKLKQYVNTTMDACEKFDQTYSRKRSKVDEIYDDGKKFDNDNTPLGFLIVVFIILVILGLILGVFKL